MVRASGVGATPRPDLINSGSSNTPRNRVMAFETVGSALDAAGGQQPFVFEPKLVALDDGRCSIYPGDAGYESAALEASGPRHRLWMRDSGWRYEKTITD